MQITITKTYDIPIERVMSLLCSAFEGGSNSWYYIQSHDTGEYDIEDFKEGGKMQPANDYWHWAEIVPTIEGCCLWITAPGAGEPYESEHRLGLPELNQGMSVMADKYPHHFKDFMDQNDDAATGDVYLQCCLYGEVVFD